MVNDSKQKVQLSESIKGKYVVSDTSSLLMAGTSMLSIMEGCSLIIPAIVVKELEEKRSDQRLGFLAREWIRLLEDNRVKHGIDLSKGVKLDEYDVFLRVEPNHSNQESLPIHLQNKSNDSTVLAVAQNLINDKDVKDDVVILSNDAPMRLNATLDLHIDAYEFNATQIVGAKAFDGRYKVHVSDEEYADSYKNNSELHKLILNRMPKNCANHSFVNVHLNNDEHLLDVMVNVSEGKVVEVGHKTKTYNNITARTREQDVALSYLKKSANDVPIVSIGGGAGTGKTLLTIANGLEELKLGNYQKVIVFRSLHEMGAGQEMGFLPGNVDEKMNAWAGAIYDALDVLAAKKKPAKKNSGPHVLEAQKKEAETLREMIEISPITYLRGRSLANTYMVLEEAQNFSRSEILNILSRAGEGSKIVLTFDAAQVDNRFLQSGKDADIWAVIDTLKNSDLFAHITLLKTERSKVAELASGILEQ